jgi:CBS domain-containing protein
MNDVRREPEPKKVPILRRTLVAPDESRSSVEVFCPSQEATVSAERCETCAFLKAFPRHAAQPGATIECTPPNLAAKDEASRSRPMDLVERAARAPLGEVVRRRIVCVTEATSLGTAVRLMMEDGVDSLPVVTDGWRLVGTLSKSDIVRARFDDGGGEPQPPVDRDLDDGFHLERVDGTVGDVMTRSVHTLPEDARLTHAMSLMAVEDVLQVPVLTADGVVVGVITSLDCLRWVARQMGYVVPWRAG